MQHAEVAVPTGARMNWQMAPWFWVRSAGFPIEHVAREPVSSEDPNFAAIVAGRRAALLDALSEPAMEQAIYLSNREALLRLRSLRDKVVFRARERQAWRLAWSYLQRFCTKNDTAGYWGPLSWGHVGGTFAIDAAVGQPWLRRRTVYFEHWLVQHVADAVSADPEVHAWLPVRLNPGCTLVGDLLSWPLGHSRRVSGETLEVLQRAGLERADATAAAAELVRVGILVRRIILPTAIHHPERALRAAVSSLPSDCPGRERWLSYLDELDELRARIQLSADANPVADAQALETRIECERVLQARVEQRCGVPAARATGRMYVGRYLTYDDAERALDVRIGEDFANGIRDDLGPVLDLHRHVCAVVVAALHTRWSLVLERLGGSCELLTWLHAVSSEEIEGPVREQVRAQLARAWQGIAHEGDELRLDAGSFAALHDALGPAPAPPRQLDVHSVDLLFACPDVRALAAGDVSVFIGEIHPCVHLVAQPVALPFCPDRDAVSRHADALLGDGTLVMVDPPAGYQRSHVDWPAVQCLHEVVPPGCVPRSLERAAFAGACRVEIVRGRLVLCHGSLRTDLAVALPGALHRILFSLAADVLGAAVPPRIHAGRVVIKRRSWRIRTADLPEAERPGEDALAFARVRTWAQQQGLPNHAFVIAPGEPKPVHVDFGNPLSCDLFMKLARAADELRLSEMRPAPDELWLKDARGSFTSEFRTTFTRGAQ